MTLAPFLSAQDADTVTLDLGVFIAKRARRYRTSQSAIIAAMRQALDQPRLPIDDHAPLSADAVERLLKAIDEVDPTKPQPIESSPAARLSEGTTDEMAGEATPSASPAEPDNVPLHFSLLLAGAESEVEPTPSPEGSNRDRVEQCHHEHPEWPSKVIAQHLGMSHDAVRAAASRRKLKLVSWWDYQRGLPPEQRTVQVRPKAGPTQRDRVRDAIAGYPLAGAKELAAILDMSEHSVRAIASQIGARLPTLADIKAATTEALKAAQPKPVEAESPPSEAEPAAEPEPQSEPTPRKHKRITLADKIRGHLVIQPDATLRDVATATGASLTSIGWAAQKAGITLRKYTAEERSEATARGALKRALPPAAPQPVSSAAPAIAPEHHGAIKRAPQGRFYLRDKDGRYVHQGLLASPTGAGPMMTEARAWAWYDTMERYKGAKRKWPELASMRKEAAQP